jgi:hypothetical protein
MKKQFWSILILISVVLSACGGPITFPKIDRQPPPSNWDRGDMTSVPTHDPDSDEMWQMDLRAYDLSQLDLSNSSNDLTYASFDSRTKWPAADKMPPDFDWQQIMEVGKNPGLGIRQLHEQGITGRGVGIAIIDQTLLVDHQEYVDQLRLYEEMKDVRGGWLNPQMHGPAVASIAVGKTVGVAPGADLYYIATADCGADTAEEMDFSCRAQSVRRILEVNEQLPTDRKIRVISMAFGWGPDRKGYDEIATAAEEAKAAGMLVICSSVEQVHGFKFHGLGRAPLADPDSFQSYEPGLFWAKQFGEGWQSSDRLLIPMDSRTTAAPTGVDEYAFYRQGGWSWSIPYIAGVYALAAQVKPTITPDEFWSLALETGQTVELEHEGETIAFGPILDPAALIAALQK